MSHTTSSPLANLMLVSVGTILFLVDERRRRRGQRWNANGLCARCGGVQDEPGGRVAIAGGPRWVWRGRVCNRCYATVKLHERIVWSFVGAATVAALALMFVGAHSGNRA